MIEFVYNMKKLDFKDKNIYVFRNSLVKNTYIKEFQKKWSPINSEFYTFDEFFNLICLSNQKEKISPWQQHLFFFQANHKERNFCNFLPYSKKFFAFWKKYKENLLNYEQVDKVILPYQENFWQKLQKQKIEYLKILEKSHFFDEIFESDYDMDIFDEFEQINFVEATNFTQKQLSFLQNFNKRVAMHFSFDKQIFDQEKICLKKFAPKDIQRVKSNRITIFVAPDKFTMFSEFLMLGFKQAVVPSFPYDFSFFDNFCDSQNCLLKKIYLYFVDILPLLSSYSHKSSLLPISEVLVFVQNGGFNFLTQNSEEYLDEIYDMINDGYKFIDKKGLKHKNHFFEILMELFAKFDNSKQNFFHFLEKVSEDIQYQKAFNIFKNLKFPMDFSSPEFLEIFVELLKERILKEQTEEIKCSLPQNAKPQENIAFLEICQNALPSAPEPLFLLSEKQKTSLGIMNYKQKIRQEKFNFFCLALKSSKTTIFTIENTSENTITSSFLDELMLSLEDIEKIVLPSISYSGVFNMIFEREILNKKDSFSSIPYNAENFKKFSYSKFKDLLDNPFDYYLKSKISSKQLPNNKIDGSILGKFVHCAFERMLKENSFSHKKIEGILTNLLREYKLNLPKNYHKIYFEMVTLALIKKSMLNFLKYLDKDKKKITEKTFVKTFNKFKLYGKIDLVLGDILYDFKTGSKQDNLQLDFYKLVSKSSKAYFYSVFKNLMIKQKREKDIVQILESRIKEIQERGFFATKKSYFTEIGNFKHSIKT